MVWVKAEYAEELAVVSAWLMALLPWSISYGRPAGGRFFAIRFTFVLFEDISGLGELSGSKWLTPLDALHRTVGTGLVRTLSATELESRYGTTDPGLSVGTLLDALTVADNGEAVLAYLLMAIGVLVLALAVGLSLLMYFELEVLDRIPYDVVRVMGVLLAVAAVLYTAATVALYLQFPGIYVPIGPFLYVALASILLRVERT